MIDRPAEYVIEQGFWARLDRVITERIKLNPRKLLWTAVLSFASVVAFTVLDDGGLAEQAGVSPEVIISSKMLTCAFLEQMAKEQGIEVPASAECAGFQILVPGEEPPAPPVEMAEAQAVAGSTPPTQHLIDQNQILRAEVARLSNVNSDLEAAVSEADGQTASLSADNQRLRVALADALADKDSAINQAAIQSALEVRTEYEDQVCFRRTDSDAERIASLCARLGDE